MANAKTEHSISLRNKTAVSWVKRKKEKGEQLRVNVSFYDEKSISQMKSLKITPTEFLRKALKLLNENGDVK